MSSPTDINVDPLGSIAKEKSLHTKVPSRFNLESQLFQDTYEVEYSSAKNVQSSVEDWIDVPSADFHDSSGKYVSLDSAPVKQGPQRTLSAYGNFQGGSNYSLGSQMTDTSHISGVSHHNPLGLTVGIPLGSNSGSFHLPNHQQYTPTSVPPSLNQQFSPSVFRPRLEPTRYRTSNGQFVEMPTPPQSVGSNGGGFFSSHENSFQSMNGYLSHNTSQNDMTAGLYNDDVPPDTMIFVVAFKTTCRDYILGVRIPSIVKVGDKVIVSADRGEDLGTVTEIISYDQFLYQRFQLVRPLTTYFNLNKFVGRILRFASDREVRTLGMKQYDENEVVKYGVHLINHVYKLNMTIYDAEFQFDRHKLTIYYDCLGRVDFREFVKAVHVTFNARVWMEKVNSNTFNANSPHLQHQAPMQPQQQLLQQQGPMHHAAY